MSCVFEIKKRRLLTSFLYYNNFVIIKFILVHLAGIEPVRVASLDPKSSASASSAIGAAILFNNKYSFVSR